MNGARIKRMRLVNFRCHRELVVNLEGDGAVMITGPNWAGKSSLLEAIQFLVCGRTIHTQANGVGVEELITDGETELRVQALVDPGARLELLPDPWRFQELFLERSFINTRGGGWGYAIGTMDDPRDIQATGWKEVAAILWGDPKLAWSILSQELLSMNATDRQAALAGALGLDSVPLDVLLGEEADSEDEIRRARLHVAELLDIPRERGPELTHVPRPKVGLVHRKLVAERREEQNRVEAQRGQEAGPKPDQPKPELDKIRATVKALEEEDAARARDIREADKAVAGLEAKLDEAQERQAERRAELAELEELIKPGRKREKGPTASELEELDRQIEAKVDGLAAVRDDERAVEAERRALEGQEFGGCPKGDQGCAPLWSSRREERLAELEARAEKLAEPSKRLRTECDALRRQRDELSKAREATTKREAKLREARASARELKAQLEASAKAIEGIEASLRRAREAADAAAAIPEVQGLSAAQEEERQARELAGRWAQYESAIQEVNTSSLDFLRWLEERMNPAGPLQEWVNKRAARLRARVQEAAAAVYPDRELNLELDPFQATVDGRRWELLSDSEQLRLHMALQAAMARVAGVELLLLDRVDWLDPEGRGDFLELLRGFPGQVVAAATSQVDRDELPDVPGVRFVWLDRAGEGDGDA